MWNAVSPHSCGSSPHIVATVMSTGWRLTDIWSHLCILSKRRTTPVTIYPVEEKPGTLTTAFTEHSGKSTWTLIMSTTLNAVGEASSLHASQTGSWMNPCVMPRVFETSSAPLLSNAVVVLKCLIVKSVCLNFILF